MNDAMRATKRLMGLAVTGLFTVPAVSLVLLGAVVGCGGALLRHLHWDPDF